MALTERTTRRLQWIAGVSGTLFILSSIILVLIAWQGVPLPCCGFTITDPKRPILAAGVFFSLWMLLRPSVWQSRQALAGAVGQLVLLGLSAVVCILLAEMTLRAALRQRQSTGSLETLADGSPVRPHAEHALARIIRLSPNRNMVYELMPGLDTDFGHRRVRTNHAGMRQDTDCVIPKPPGTFRVLGIGDSGMFGWNVEQGEDYMSVLGKQLALRKSDTTFEVLNMAVPGYDTFQEVQMLETRGLAYGPDIVVLGWCDNDFDVPFFLFSPRKFNERNKSYVYMLVFKRNDFRAALQPALAKGHQTAKDQIPPELLAETGTPGVNRSLKRLKELADKHSFRLVLIGPMGSAIVSICDSLGIRHINSRKEIDPSKYPADYGVHSFHPRAGGHRVLAEHLLLRMDEWGWLPGTRSGEPPPVRIPGISAPETRSAPVETDADALVP